MGSQNRPLHTFYCIEKNEMSMKPKWPIMALRGPHMGQSAYISPMLVKFGQYARILHIQDPFDNACWVVVLSDHNPPTFIHKMKKKNGS